MYVAAYGTDRIAKVDANGTVLSFIEIGPGSGSTVDPRRKRGPRGLALQAQRLYVLNRISNSISVIDTSANAVLTEMPVGSFDPTPVPIRNGRGFLYDAKLSGNGTGSCASCHLDGDIDKVAWNLGDPNGEMQTVVSNERVYLLHPMKGPMTTRTLRGLLDMQPYQWRGDQQDLRAINQKFDSLLGGTPLAEADLTAYVRFLNAIRFQPNPNQNLDRTLPASINGADPNAGRAAFLNLSLFADAPVTCNTCHMSNPGPGTNNVVGPFLRFLQPFKVSHLLNVYQKLDLNTTANAASIDGFGLINDGSGSSVQSLIAQNFPKLNNIPRVKDNIAAFLLCFDTGMAPAVGYTRTVTPQNYQNSSLRNDWTLLQSQAAAGNIELIGKGTINGQVRGLLYRPVSNDYQSDRSGLAPFTQAELVARIASGDTVTFMGVPVGSGSRMGVDRDLDAVLDGDESPARR